jgi:hypothetical protein
MGRIGEMIIVWLADENTSSQRVKTTRSGAGRSGAGAVGGGVVSAEAMVS